MQNRAHTRFDPPGYTLLSERTSRMYEVSAVRADGSLYVNQFRAPAIPLIDNAFSAFAHGALLATPYGPVAIEDLRPGDRVKTSSGEPAEVVWIGSSVFAPSAHGPHTSLVRMMADTFGPSRPASFVTMGPAARIFQTPSHLKSHSGETPLLTPARAFVDNVNVIAVSPPTPVRLFHICLTRHAAVDVGGIQMETFHPGSTLLRGATHTQRDFFMSMFPRIAHPTDFGPLAHPRAPETEDATAA